MMIGVMIAIAGGSFGGLLALVCYGIFLNPFDKEEAKVSKKLERYAHALIIIFFVSAALAIVINVLTSNG